MTEDHVITALDVLGLLVMAAGLSALLYPRMGWGSLIAGGLLILLGARAAELRNKPSRPPR